MDRNREGLLDMLGLSLNTLYCKIALVDKRFSFVLSALQIAVPKRVDWRGLTLSLSTGRGWAASVGLLGLYWATYLEQPEWEEGEEIQVAKRVYKYGFNHFQLVRTNAE